jgi:hypothetical protein
MSIKTIDLSCNKIGDAGILLFANDWSNSSPIQKLALSSHNEIGLDGTLLLLEQLPPKHTGWRCLCSLDLSNNQAYKNKKRSKQEAVSGQKEAVQAVSRCCPEQCPLVPCVF